MSVIDLHSHYFPAEAVARCPAAGLELAKLPDGNYRFTAGGKGIVLPSQLFDLEQQIADVHRQGLSRRVLSVPPFCFMYELPPPVGVEWCRVLNDGIAAAAREHPESLIGFATVPLQDVNAALDELTRAVSDLDLKGVEIATNINGLELDSPVLEPFWAEVAGRRLPLLIHPHYVAGQNRMGEYNLRNLVGNPTETALAGARLLLGGVLERHPHLLVILSHGGGALPHLVGRLEHGYRVRPECRSAAIPPSTGLKQFYYDTVVFHPMVLKHVVEIVGASQLILGTDYPFDMSEDHPIEFIRQSGLLPMQVDEILASGARIVLQQREALS